MKAMEQELIVDAVLANSGSQREAFWAIHFAMTIGDVSDDARHEAMHIVYDQLRPYGGSISAEHGIGLEKRPYLGYCRSDQEIEIMRSLKNALDPAGILNPGKVF